MTPLVVQAAGEQDVDLVLRLVQACITDMRRSGIEQWDEVYPDRATILGDVHGGTMYLASLDTAPVGALVVNDVQSPEYADVPWTIQAARVAVVHRLMIDPRYQGQGIARQLMNFAEAHAAGLGFDAVRLDAFSANPRALQLYQRLGYHDAGRVTFRKGVFWCFEKRIGA
jgi:GNAT superfamily N-acetyltransferase